MPDPTANPNEYSLLEKTELQINDLELTGANLTEVATVVGRVFDLPSDDVIVIDARSDRLALDLHRDSINPRQIVGMQSALFAALDAIDGVAVNERTTVTSEGMLGWIAQDRDEALAALDRADTMRADIDAAIARRVLVLSTGPEVLHGHIEDTNQPYLVAQFDEAGFSATSGGVVDDDEALLVARLREAGGDLGYGLVITTGGVGAETKDHTVEAMLQLDPDAHTPYIMNFEVGHGRHAKDGVRICVARYGTATLVALPGPHDEVIASTEVLLELLQAGAPNSHLADRLATSLRTIVRAKFARHKHA